MTHETKSEIVIAVIVAAFFALLWWMNRANGAGSGLEALPSSTGTPLFDVNPGDPGVGSVNFGAPSYNIGGSTVDVSNPASCNCGASSTWLNFGSPGDMSAWLSAVPNYLQTAQNGLTDWN